MLTVKPKNIIDNCKKHKLLTLLYPHTVTYSHTPLLSFQLLLHPLNSYELIIDSDTTV